MSSELTFAKILSQQLGPLFHVTVLDETGATVKTFGRGSRRRTISNPIPLPNSRFKIMIDVDTHLVEAADRVLHDLVAPIEMPSTPLGNLANLEDALNQLVRQGEAFVGRPLDEMSRVEKQQLVRYLDERGAFALRKAVETVARTLGVSRFTVYNYLESVRGQ